jgi:hypothetical protein
MFELFLTYLKLINRQLQSQSQTLLSLSQMDTQKTEPDLDYELGLYQI